MKKFSLPYIKVALSQLFKPYSTENFPKVVKEAPEHYRGRIKYHPELCVGCGMCERVCAGQAITRIVENVPDGQKVTMTFDMNSCTFCSFCADFCSRHAIELTTDYLMVARGDERIISTGSFLKKAPPATPKAVKTDASGVVKSLKPEGDAPVAVKSLKPEGE